MKRSAFLSVLAGIWLASGAAIAVPFEPGGEWIRIQSAGIEDKPFPILWFSAEAIEVPGRESVNHLTRLPAAAYAEVRTVARTQCCPGTRKNLRFELTESTRSGYRAPCMLDVDETCRLLVRIERIPALAAPADRHHAVNALQDRLACPGRAPVR